MREFRPPPPQISKREKSMKVANHNDSMVTLIVADYLGFITK
jgi:hypothetical protein